MKQLKNFLLSLRGDVFKLLPMRESELNGFDKHLDEYIDAMIVNLTGAITTYPVLARQKQYLYVLNNLNYLRSHDVDFRQWRTIVLTSTRYIDNLYDYYGGIIDEE